MSTNATISIYKENGTINSIYNHNCGLPTDLGIMLMEHYNTEALVIELISMGDVSYVGSKIHPQNPETHSFVSPEPDVCLFYSRDRNEDDCETQEFNSIKEILFHYGMPYNYLFKDNRWYIINEDLHGNCSLVDLDEEIKQYK